MKSSDVQSSAAELKRRSLTEQEQLAELVHDSTTIFVGTVVELGEAPIFWSGRIPAYQTVRYNVGEILKGGKIPPDITVHHIVVKNSKTADPGDEPRLSASLFSKDAKLIVFAQKADDGTWRCLDESQGATPFSAEAVEKIKKALKK